MELVELTLPKIKDEFENLNQDRPEFVRIKEEIEDVNTDGYDFPVCRAGLNGENLTNAFPATREVKIEPCETAEVKEENYVDATVAANSCMVEIKEEQQDTTSYQLANPKKLLNPGIICGECGLWCRDRRTYKLHVMDHTGRPFKCTECDKSYKKSTDLLYHKKTHTGDHDIHCEACGKGFAVKSALRAHMRTHSKEKPYVCPVCNKGFSHSSSLKPHMAMHSEDLPYECQECDKKFKTHKNLSTHKRSHMAEDERAEQCNFCPKLYKSKEGLRLHLLKHKQPLTPTADPPIFTCEQCGNSYKHAISLKNHLRTHNGNMFACHMCGKSYITLKLLDIHVRNHTGETPFDCTVCGKKFKRRDSWLYHKTTHENDRKRYKCDMCDKVLVCKSGLRVHKTYVHTNGKPFRCEYCLQSYKFRYDLTRHLRKHKKKDEEDAEGKPTEEYPPIPEMAIVKEEAMNSKMEESSSAGGGGQDDVVKVFKCKCNSLFDSENELKKHKLYECAIVKIENDGDEGSNKVVTKHIKEEITMKTEKNCEDS